MTDKTYFWCAERTEESIYKNKASGLIRAADCYAAMDMAKVEARKSLNNTKAFTITAFNLVE